MWCDARRRGIGGAIGSDRGSVVGFPSYGLSRKRQDVAVGCREDATAGCTRDVVVTCRGETTTGCRGCRGGGCIGLEAPPLAVEDAKDACVEVWRTLDGQRET